MNKIPDKIKIMGLNYAIHFDSPRDIDRGAGTGGAEGASGWSSSSMLEIHIQNDLSLQSMWWVLIHEVGEQINELVDLELEHDKIVSLGSILYQVLVDNDLLRIE